MSATGGDEPDPPLVRVLRGSPTDEELAALVAVVAARAAAAPSAVDSERVRRSAWSDRARAVRPAHRPGPGAWRASAWPG